MPDDKVVTLADYRKPTSKMFALLANPVDIVEMLFDENEKVSCTLLSTPRDAVGGDSAIGWYIEDPDLVESMAVYLMRVATHMRIVTEKKK